MKIQSIDTFKRNKKKKKKQKINKGKTSENNE